MKREKFEGLDFIVGERLQITRLLLAAIDAGRGFTLLPASLNDVAALENRATAVAYRQLSYCVTDGMPLVWFFRLKNFWRGKRKKVERVYGPTLMKSIFQSSGSDFRHFLYGSSPLTLKLLQKNLQKISPSAQLVGAISPPFRELTIKEEARYLAQIKKQKTQVLWLGLSSPKQVALAVRWQKALPGVAIFCVGAAFDFLAGRQLMAPALIQDLGGEWLFRLLVDPKRLWKRYLMTIPRYFLRKLFDFFFVRSSIQ